jgi:hypothetical protein
VDRSRVAATPAPRLRGEDVTGMDAALAKLVDRYPWLSDEPLKFG